MTSDPSITSYDFFISYTSRDEAWAEWIAWHLKAQGYTLRFQKWHFIAGNSWVVEMQKALQQCRRMVAVLSPDYLKSEHGQAEWNVFYAKDPDGSKASLIPVRVAQTDLDDLHKTRSYIDFVGKDEAACLQALLQGLRPAEPAVQPPFPGVGSPAAAPVFPGAGSKAPISAIPNNLPRLHSFFGREKELKTIADALSPKTRTWGVLIDGPGGIGKTSLAIRAAESCPEGQFQRILFLSSKGRNMTADGERQLSDFVVPGYLDMLNEIARLLKRPDFPKQPESERSKLVITALEPEKALLILDNLESLPKDQQDKLFEFLSQLPPGCKAIVTSRRRTDVDARIIRLDKLDEAAALSLLEELAIDRPLLAKAGQGDRRHLYEETGGNPLLLRWIAGQLGKGRCRTVDAALELLRSAPPDNDPLEFIFGDILETFTENETQALAALSYFTQPMEVKFIAELAAISKAAAETALGDLSSRALVVPDEEEKNYFLVPMVATFLRRKRPEQVKEAGGRLERHARTMIEQNGGKKHARFPILDAEWPRVAPALSLLLAGPNQALQAICNSLRVFFNFTGRWDEWLTLSEQAEVNAEAAGDYNNAGWRANDAGDVYSLRRDGDSVLLCARKAAAHWDKAGSGLRERGLAMRLRGLGYQLKADSIAAINAYRESLDLFRSISAEGDDVANVLNLIAGIERSSGEPTAAERDYGEALRIAVANGDVQGRATCIGNLAGMALDRNNWKRAEVLAREALELAANLGRRELTAGFSEFLATALVKQGKYAEALPLALRAFEIFAQLGSPRRQKALKTLAECRRAFALERLNHGWTYNTTTLEGNTLSLSEVEQALTDPGAVIAHRPAEHVAATRSQGEALRLMAEFLEANGDWTSEDVFRLHTVLMQGSTVDSFKPVGAWKIEDNGTTVKLDGKRVWNDSYAPAHHVRGLMTTWLSEFNRRREGGVSPFEDHVWLHATFVRIHPFADGNGRMARLLANVPLLAAGLDPVDIPASARDHYLESLARWQIACGPPHPNAPLLEKPELLADFRSLCASSRHGAEVRESDNDS